MAKRFIDTGLFDDEWFAELNQECKIFWVYYLTKCDHAGLLKNNKRLIEFQTGIKSLERVTEHFADRLATVNGVFFCHKFILFQYPGFPKSNVKQQDSAIQLLIKAGIWDENFNKFKDLNNSYQRVTKDLPKSYDSGNDNVIVNVNEHDYDSGSEKIELIFPFESEEFHTHWGFWKKYKKEQFKFSYKSVITEQAALNNLVKLSGGKETTALEIILQSISNTWKGFFEIKNKNNGQSTSKNGKPNLTTKETAAEFDRLFAERYGNGRPATSENIN